MFVQRAVWSFLLSPVSVRLRGRINTRRRIVHTRSHIIVALPGARRWEFVNPHSYDVPLGIVPLTGPHPFCSVKPIPQSSDPAVGIAPETFRSAIATVHAMPPRVHKNLCNRESERADGRVVTFRLQALPPEEAPVPVPATRAFFSAYGRWPPDRVRGRYRAIPRREGGAGAGFTAAQGVGVNERPQWGIC